jgi:hypothetical protein
LSKIEIIVSRPDKEKIEAILEKTGMNKKDLKCSICKEPISDLKRIRAIFPYHSALVCCDKIECLLACRDRLITEPILK